MSGDLREESPFGRFDAATLLAVEGANGGEWAGVGQTLVTFHLLFGEWPDPEDFAGSCELLLAAGLLGYEHDGLSLLPAGRKLLRRAGRHGSPSRPEKVAELLGYFDEGDLADVADAACPSAEDVTAARHHLTDDVTDDFATLHASNVSRLLGPPMVLPGGIGAGTGYADLPGVLRSPEAAADEAPPEDDEAD